MFKKKNCKNVLSSDANLDYAIGISNKGIYRNIIVELFYEQLSDFDSFIKNFIKFEEVFKEKVPRGWKFLNEYLA